MPVAGRECRKERAWPAESDVVGLMEQCQALEQLFSLLCLSDEDAEQSTSMLAVESLTTTDPIDFDLAGKSAV